MMGVLEDDLTESRRMRLRDQKIEKLSYTKKEPATLSPFRVRMTGSSLGGIDKTACLIDHKPKARVRCGISRKNDGGRSVSPPSRFSRDIGVDKTDNCNHDFRHQ